MSYRHLSPAPSYVFQVGDVIEFTNVWHTRKRLGAGHYKIIEIMNDMYRIDLEDGTRHIALHEELKLVESAQDRRLRGINDRPVSHDTPGWNLDGM